LNITRNTVGTERKPQRSALAHERLIFNHFVEHDCTGARKAGLRISVMFVVIAYGDEKQRLSMPGIRGMNNGCQAIPGEASRGMPWCGSLRFIGHRRTLPDA